MIDITKRILKPKKFIINALLDDLSLPVA